jgi:formate dehydrogenase subunit gamma
MRDKHHAEYMSRFSIYRVIEHQAGAITFAVLAVTGLAQKFHGASWAEWVIMGLGGIDTSRVIHRTTGLIFAFLTLQHVLVASYGMMFRKWTPSMVINKRDFTDVIHNLKYYFGMEESPARCGRYDYKQKFEYWGVVVGGVLMIFTGLILWFPTAAFRLAPVLPGQIIPAAKATHTNEAMLAFLVIVIWHIYNSVFSPEVFPMDTGIFTGKISKERMVHEHPLEYESVTGLKLGETHAEGPEDLKSEG